MTLLEKLMQVNNEQLIEEYNSANNSISIDELDAYTNAKVSWKCSVCTYKWDALPKARFRKNKPTGCPACMARQGKLNKTIPGINDMYTWCKNNNRMYLIDMIELAGIDNPHTFNPQSEKKIHLKCTKCKEEFTNDPTHLTRKIKPAGCPNCNKYKQSSTEELIMFNIVKHYFPNAIHRLNPNTALELDAYIKELEIGIEWDGYYYHGINMEHSTKAKKLKDTHILRIISVPSIKDSGITKVHDNEVVKTLYMGKESSLIELMKTIVEYINKFGCNLQEMNNDELLNIQNITLLENTANIAINNGHALSELLDECNKKEFKELNEGINPNSISSSSKRIFKFKCNKCKEVFEISALKIYSKGKVKHPNCKFESLKYVYPTLASLIISPDTLTLSPSTSKEVTIKCHICNSCITRKLSYIVSNNIIKGNNMICKNCKNIIYRGETYGQ